MLKRINTRSVHVKDVQIGGQNKVIIQSMTLSRPKDIDETVKEINTYATLGAKLVRVAIVDMEDALAISAIKSQTNVPLVADIHFDYRLALEVIKQGIDKIRINPGNIGSTDKIKQVVTACKAHHIPIRIGINAGSLEKDLITQYGHTAQAMVESAKRHVNLLASLAFHDIVLSLKASDVQTTIAAYLLAAKTFPYPLHIGITESGPLKQGLIHSAAGLGTLLHYGIGDTIRISLSADRVEEIDASKKLLAAFDLYQTTKIISCPGCGRLAYDMRALLEKIEDYLRDKDLKITVAVMGCAVNGPGEASLADIGVAGGNGEGLIFRKGKIIRKVKEKALFSAFVAELNHLIK